LGKLLVILLALLIIGKLLGNDVSKQQAEISSITSPDAPLDAGHEAPKSTNLVDSLPNLTKPLFTKEGVPFCDTPEHLKAIIGMLSAGETPTMSNSLGCVPIKAGIKLILIEGGRFMSFTDHVRLLHRNGTAEDGWVSTYSMSNDPTPPPPERNIEEQETVAAPTPLAEPSKPDYGSAAVLITMEDRLNGRCAGPPPGAYIHDLTACKASSEIEAALNQRSWCAGLLHQPHGSIMWHTCAADTEKNAEADVSATPSFDCQRAQTPSESAICADRQLSSIDKIMADAYKKIVAVADNAESIRRDQASWRNEQRNVCGQDETCLLLAYGDRILALTAVTQ
jgi:uncharacterized protein YecT (DUF1311 family)